MKILGIKSTDYDLFEIDLNFKTLTRRFPLSTLENDLDYEAARVILDELESRYWLNQDEEVYTRELRRLIVTYMTENGHAMA